MFPALRSSIRSLPLKITRYKQLIGVNAREAAFGFYQGRLDITQIGIQNQFLDHTHPLGLSHPGASQSI